MDSKTMVTVIAVVVIAAVAAVALGMHPTPSASQGSQAVTTAGQGSNSATASDQTKVLFANTQYAPYSYQVYPGPLSQQAQAALSGFSMKNTTLQNSSVIVTLTVVGSGQQQTVVLQPGYKLYIVEATFGDDSFRSDYSLGDDGFVVVDPNGYVA